MSISIQGVRMDAQAVSSLLRSPQGAVMRHAMVKGDEVKAGARRRVGVSQNPGSQTRGGGGQHLRDAIVKRLTTGRDGPQVEVIAERPYAFWHHEGTDPHPIRPVRAKALRFTSGAGQVVFARSVQHPGTQPNRFLTDAARAAGLTVRRNLRRGGLR